MRLTSFERRQLADYITSSEERQKEILRAACADPSVSGPLVRAFMQVLGLI
jgi:hypothetical protein